MSSLGQGQTLSVVVPSEVAEQVRAIALADGRTTSNLLRRLILAGLEEKGDGTLALAAAKDAGGERT